MVTDGFATESGGPVFLLFPGRRFGNVCAVELASEQAFDQASNPDRWFCQNSGHEAKSALDSTHQNAVFEFNRLAFRVAFSLKIGGVP